MDKLVTLDTQAIDDLVKSIGSDLVYNQLLPLFSGELSDYYDEIGKLIDHPDEKQAAKRAAEICHMLKSNSVSFGAKELSVLANQIDQAYKSDQLIEQLAPQLKSLHKMLESYLHIYLNNHNDLISLEK